jgi:hypothetical protein
MKVNINSMVVLLIHSSQGILQLRWTIFLGVVMRTEGSHKMILVGRCKNKITSQCSHHRPNFDSFRGQHQYTWTSTRERYGRCIYPNEAWLLQVADSQLQAVLTAYQYYTDINGVQAASGCPKTKIVKRRFEDQERRWNNAKGRGLHRGRGWRRRSAGPGAAAADPPLALQLLLPRSRGGACSCACPAR